MDDAAHDPRAEVYQDLHQKHLKALETANEHSARVILGRLFQSYRPASILDVGCGPGSWLAAAQKLGIPELFGVEGPWWDRLLPGVPDVLVEVRDLEQAFDLGRRFDLVICLEVAEHLSREAGPALIRSLVKHADVVLFSAAIPGQGGRHHSNEQWPAYWCELFAGLDYQVLDCIRPAVWEDRSILWWLRQNTLVFARSALLAPGGPLHGAGETGGMLSVVHPDVFRAKVKALRKVTQEYKRLLALLTPGSRFEVSRDATGKPTIRKLE